jgi:hypothetical protein
MFSWWGYSEIALWIEQNLSRKTKELDGNYSSERVNQYSDIVPCRTFVNREKPKMVKDDEKSEEWIEWRRRREARSGKKMCLKEEKNKEARFKSVLKGNWREIFYYLFFFYPHKYFIISIIYILRNSYEIFSCIFMKIILRVIIKEFLFMRRF